MECPVCFDHLQSDTGLSFICDHVICIQCHSILQNTYYKRSDKNHFFLYYPCPLCRQSSFQNDEWHYIAIMIINITFTLYDKVFYIIDEYIDEYTLAQSSIEE